MKKTIQRFALALSMVLAIFTSPIFAEEEIYVYPPVDGISLVRMDIDGVYTYKYVDAEGNDISGDIYDGAMDFCQGTAVVVQNGQYKLIDTTGTTLLVFDGKYETVHHYPINGSLFVGSINTSGHRLDTRAAVLAGDGSPLTEIVYGDWSFEMETLEKEYPLPLLKDGQGYGYLDKNGKELVDFIYDSAIPFRDGIGNLQKDEKFAIIDVDGNMMSDFIYDNVIHYADGIGVGFFPDKTSIFNTKGEIIINDFKEQTSFRSGSETPSTFYIGEKTLREYLTEQGVSLEIPANRLETQEKAIQVYVNGEQLVFDQPPLLVGGFTMVPVRALADALGYEVEWIQETGTVILSDSAQKVTMVINSSSATVEFTDKSKAAEIASMDAAAQVINSRTLIPLRFVSENMGAEVDWLEESWTIHITR